MDETSLVRNNQDNNFKNYNLTYINSITLKTQAVNDNQVITEAYVDKFHQQNERSRQDLGMEFYDESVDSVKNNQDIVFNVKKLTDIDSITDNKNPSLDNELTNKKYFDDSIRERTMVRFNQTLQNYLKVPVGNETYTLTKYIKKQIIDIAFIKHGNCQYLLPRWKVLSNDKNNFGITTIFVRAIKSSSPTGDNGATTSPPIGNSFMYIETSSNNHFHERVFVSWERTDIIQFSNITFC